MDNSAEMSPWVKAQMRDELRQAKQMAANIDHLVDALLAPKPKAKPKLARNTSTLPYVNDDYCPPGMHVEADYDWEQEDVEDMPLVYVTALRFVGNDGTEYPVKLTSVDARWLSGIESLICDEIVDAQP